MTKPATPDDLVLPQDVKERFDALCAAARIPGKLAVVKATTEHYPFEHFVIGVHTDTGLFLTVGLIPSKVSVLNFLGGYDYLMGKAGGPEMDPDYQGIRQ